MDAIIRAIIIYLFLLVIFRFSEKRTLAESSPFDLILLLIISEATQGALINNDNSIINAIVVITTLIAINLALAFLKYKYKFLQKAVEGGPLVLIDNGVIFKDRMYKERIDEDEILSSAREVGLIAINQIKYAILETSGKINIIPFDLNI